MKIAFIVTNITNEGGTERVVVNLCNFLAGRPGYELEIHSLSPVEGRSFFPLDERVLVFFHGLQDYSKEPSVAGKLLKKWRNTVSIFSVFRRIKADILIGTGKHINIYLALFRSPAKIRKIGCEHFSHSAPMSRSIRFLRKTLYPSLDALVILNRADYAYYSAFMKQVVLIPNFVFFTPEGLAPLNGKVALAVGRHSVEKGFDILLEVWKEVSPVCPDWKLRIIGGGPLLETHIDLCRQLGITGSVEFMPPTKQILAEYQAASLFILPSRTEAFPMALLEAMASGLPCVSFDCEAGPRDIITNMEDGYLVTNGDKSTMASRIREVLKDADMRRQLGGNAYRNTTRFYLDRIGDKWTALFEKVASS